jgi:hypothetical protein
MLPPLSTSTMFSVDEAIQTLTLTFSRSIRGGVSVNFRLIEKTVFSVRTEVESNRNRFLNEDGFAMKLPMIPNTATAPIQIFDGPQSVSKWTYAFLMAWVIARGS